MRASPLLIMFDCDGTLADSHGHIVEYMRQAWRSCAHAVEPSEQDIRAIIGLQLAEAILALSPGLGEAQVQDIIAAYVRFAGAGDTIGGQPPLFAGIRECITSLIADGHILGIATGMGRSSLERFLAAHAIQQYFTLLKTADDGPSKPHPEILHQAMNETLIPPERTIMIGDSIYDMLLAKNAQVHAIGVAWGYETADNLLDKGAHFVSYNSQQILDSCREYA